MFRSLSLVVALVCCTSCAEMVELPSDAQRSAKDWLSLVDAQKYEASWHQASAIFQTAVTMPDWIKRVRAVRAPIGKLNSRSLRKTMARTDPAASPDGNYLLITYHSVFERNQDTVETLTLYQEADGTWRAAGYFVK